MDKTINNLPLFPLNTHVLPGGRLPLRIVESRYIRMVKESYQRKYAFAMCMLNDEGDPAQNEDIYNIATLVKIIDFETLPNNLWGIVVEGIQNINIIDVDNEKDGLRVGSCELLPLWSHEKLDDKYQILAEQYQRFLFENPKLSELYPDANYSNASWLAQRWLELLPFAAKDKQTVIGNDSVDLCLEIISEVQMNI